MKTKWPQNLPNGHKLHNRNSENVIWEYIKEHQLAFYHYCFHDSSLAFFITVVEVLLVIRLGRTKHKKGSEPAFLQWIDKFQQDLMNTFSSLNWSLLVDSNQLPEEIAITPEQYQILKDMLLGFENSGS